VKFAKYLKTKQELGSAKLRLRDVIAIDGVRAIFDGGWGLIRASNTQPALVLRFEASSADRMNIIRALIEGELADARRDITAYIEVYHHRPLLDLAYKSPADVAAAWRGVSH
jgi:phosphomannomutase/phosphoglucomutase